MKCSCCGRKKKLFESFENIGKGGNVCVDCSDILYRIHDAVSEKQMEEYQLRIEEVNGYIKKNKNSETFKVWFENDFIKRNQITKIDI